MARNSRRRTTRVNYHYNSRPWRGLDAMSNTYYKPAKLVNWEDRRQWHPDYFNRPYAGFTSPSHRLIQPMGRIFPNVNLTKQLNPDRFAHLRNLRMSVPQSRIRFDKPDQVLVCVRRKTRREIMFATKNAGRGGQRRARWNEASRISCRRS